MPVWKYGPDFKLNCTCIDISTRNYDGENNLQEGVSNRYLDQLSSTAMLAHQYVAAQNGLETRRAEETLSRLKISRTQNTKSPKETALNAQSNASTFSIMLWSCPTATEVSLTFSASFVTSFAHKCRDCWQFSLPDPAKYPLSAVLLPPINFP